MEEKIKELAMSDLGTTLLVLVEDLKKLKEGLVARSLITDSQILALKQVQGDMENVVEEFRGELAEFRADRQICGQQLNLFTDYKPEKGNQGNGRIKVNIVKRS
jgi:hypothetical protein